MKKIIYTISLVFGILLLVSLPTDAQTIFGGQIRYNIQHIKITDSTLQMVIDLNLNRLQINADRSLELTPVLTGPSGEESLMRPILINGRQRHRAFMRGVKLKRGEDDITQTYYAVIQPDKTDQKKIQYTQEMMYEPWMENARLEIRSDLCDCGGYVQQLKTEPILNRIIPAEEPIVNVEMQVAYIYPEVEEIKNRSENKDVFLDFPVNQMVILPDFGNNPRELRTIEEIIRELQNDRNLTVSHIQITGYASPEGSVTRNITLAQGRAEALSNYLSAKAGVFNGRYMVNNGGEDWAGLAHLLELSKTQNYKDEMLNIINNSYNPEERKQRLKALSGGYLWNNDLMKYFFPQLRRVVCQINYEVRSFTVDEAKVIYQHHPKQLSLEEMFRVANTYPKESTEFAEVFETAVRLFPSDPIANLNAAATALLRSDLTRAEQYLQKANKESAVYLNNLGVLYYLKGNPEMAREAFTKGSQKGNREAVENLKQLKFN
ncbi:MAG: DUF3868 domain-containing protein [Tannerella sp.]|jgi:outer membrane protein OmpA-like peptidoglycan-associated protein|nr:DUF3868 domain-containing protein [Tannerella sp.]